MVGRTLALLLARGGLRVALTRALPPQLPAVEDVRAYALNAASRQTLESLRAWPHGLGATPVRAMQVYGDEGGALRFDAPPSGDPARESALAWIVNVPELLVNLEQAIHFQPLIEWVSQPVPATLTVVCEGKASQTRDEFGVRYALTPYAQTAIAARVRVSQPLQNTAFQWFSGGEILGVLPLGDADGDSTKGNFASVVWSVRSTRVDELMTLDDHQLGEQLSLASRHLLGAIEPVSARAAWPLAQAIADRWSGPGWALAGDAAHAVHPLAGQGLNLGLGDAVELARILGDRPSWRAVGDHRLLRGYERTRKAAAAAIGGACDGLQVMFSQPHSAWASLRNWGMNGFERSVGLKQWVMRQAAQGGPF